jgi:YVTN family beta-propeller protein
MSQKLPRLILVFFLCSANILYGCNTPVFKMEEPVDDPASPEFFTKPTAVAELSATKNSGPFPAALPTATVTATPTPVALRTALPVIPPLPVKKAIPVIKPSPSATADSGTKIDSLTSQFSALKSFGSRLFVADKLANKLHIINTATNNIEKSIAVSSAPSSISISPDGTRLYVASGGSAVIDVINLGTLEKVDTIETSGTVYDIEASNTRLYITFDTWTKNPEIIDLASKETVGAFPEYVYSQSVLEISKDGNTVYVGSIGGSPASLWKVDVSVDPPVLVKEDEHGSLGSNMRDMVLSPDGKNIYLACGFPYYIQIIDTTTFKAAGQLPTGPYPESVDLTADGKYTVGTHATGEIQVFDNTSKTLKTNTMAAFRNYSVNLATVSADGKKVYGIVRYDSEDNGRIAELIDISDFNTSTLLVNNSVPAPVRTPVPSPTVLN